VIDPKQFRDLVIRPTLIEVGMHSTAAENLLLGTAIKESGLRFLRQHGNGPALGVYQIEPATHADIWTNYLKFRPESRIQRRPDSSLITDLAYSTVIARLVYWRRPEPMPDADDVEGLGAYWKQHYNTPLGKGTAAGWVLKFLEYSK